MTNAEAMGPVQTRKKIGKMLLNMLTIRAMHSKAMLGTRRKVNI